MVADIVKDLRAVPERLKEVPERLKEVPERLKEVPERLKEVPDRIREAPERITARRQEVGRRVRGRLSNLRDESEERAWDLERRALEAAEDLLEKAADLPGMGRVAPSAEKKVQERLQSITQPPIDDYDALNVKRICAALRGMQHVDLAKVSRYEEAHKNRKTVLRGVESEIKRQRAAQNLGE